MRSRFYYLLLLLVSGAFPAAAQQVPKLVVAEHFTNTYCSVCASRNPALFNTLLGYPDVLYISYHPSRPYPACPLNQHNMAENDDRTNYYGVFGATPQLLVQGKHITSQYTDTTIFSSQQNKKTSFTTGVNIMLTADSFEVRTVIRKTDTSSLLSATLYGALVEDTLFFTAQNGETLHRNVFRKMLWPSAAISLPQYIGDSIVFTTRVAKHTAWNLRRIFAVAIVQDANREIVQAGRSANVFISTGVNNVALAGLRIYPNPAQEQLQIESGIAGSQYVSITDITGKMLYQATFQQRAVINISSWASGCYYLRTGGQVAKFIKQ